MDRLEGLDAELGIEEGTAEKVMDIEEAKKKRKPFHVWEVGGIPHKMKLNTAMITVLENKYRKNIMNVVTDNGVPQLSVMLTVAQAAISPWEHGTSYEKVKKMFDTWVEQEDGNQMDFYTDVILPTMAVSGFFTPVQAESILRSLEEAKSLQ